LTHRSFTPKSFRQAFGRSSLIATSPCQIDLSLSGAAIAARTAAWDGHIGTGLSRSSEVSVAHASTRKGTYKGQVAWHRVAGCNPIPWALALAPFGKEIVSNAEAQRRRAYYQAGAATGWQVPSMPPSALQAPPDDIAF
jgi:hypothetical protein